MSAHLAKMSHSSSEDEQLILGSRGGESGTSLAVDERARAAGGCDESTAARGVREADEWPSLVSRFTTQPRSYAQNDMVCLTVAAATVKSALPRGRSVASKGAAWWCC